MSHSITIKFEELPTVLIDGAEGGWIDGQAEIEFSPSGQWSVEAVSVELHPCGTMFGTPRRLIALNAGHDGPLFSQLVDMIEKRCKTQIEDAIDEYFDDEPATIAEMRREFIRSCADVVDMRPLIRGLA